MSESWIYIIIGAITFIVAPTLLIYLFAIIASIPYLPMGICLVALASMVWAMHEGIPKN